MMTSILTSLANQAISCIATMLVLACLVVSLLNLRGRMRAWTLMTGFGVLTFIYAMTVVVVVLVDSALLPGFASMSTGEWIRTVSLGTGIMRVFGWALILVGLRKVFREFRRERDRCDELAAELAGLSAGKGEPQWNVERATS